MSVDDPKQPAQEDVDSKENRENIEQPQNNAENLNIEEAVEQLLSDGEATVKKSLEVGGAQVDQVEQTTGAQAEDVGEAKVVVDEANQQIQTAHTELTDNLSAKTVEPKIELVSAIRTGDRMKNFRDEQAEYEGKKEEIANLKARINKINEAVGGSNLTDTFLGREEGYDATDPGGWAEKEVQKAEEKIRELEGVNKPKKGEQSEDDLIAEELALNDEIKAKEEAVSGPIDKDIEAIDSELEKISDDELEEMVDAELDSISSPEQQNAARTQAVEATQEANNMTPVEKKTFLEGLANLGYKVDIAKNKSLRWVFNQVSQKIGAEGNNNASMVSKYFQKLSETYDKDIERSQKQVDTVGKGMLAKTGGMGKGIGTIMKYGRVLYDFTGDSVKRLNPFRHVTAAAMTAGRGLEAGKETRLDSEAMMNKTRVGKQEDIDILKQVQNGEIEESAMTPEQKEACERAEADLERAEEEAWKVYEEAQSASQEGKPSGEELADTYKKRVPRDVLDRLGRGGYDGSFFTTKLLENDAGGKADRIINKLNKIDLNQNLNPEEKAKRKEAILLRYDKLITDLDRMVADNGMVDKLAGGLRVAETTSKGLANALILDSAKRMWDSASQIYHKFDEMDLDMDKIAEGGKSMMGKLKDKAVDMMGGLGAESGIDISNLSPSEKETFKEFQALIEKKGAGKLVSDQELIQVIKRYPGDPGRAEENLNKRLWIRKLAKTTIDNINKENTGAENNTSPDRRVPVADSLDGEIKNPGESDFQMEDTVKTDSGIEPNSSPDTPDNTPVGAKLAKESWADDLKDLKEAQEQQELATNKAELERAARGNTAPPLEDAAKKVLSTDQPESTRPGADGSNDVSKTENMHFTDKENDAIEKDLQQQKENMNFTDKENDAIEKDLQQAKSKLTERIANKDSAKKILSALEQNGISPREVENYSQMLTALEGKGVKLDEAAMLKIAEHNPSAKALEQLKYALDSNITGRGGGKEKLAASILENIKKTGDIEKSLATIYKGEGIQHAMRRLIESNPQSYGFTKNPGDFKTPAEYLKALKQFSGAEAHKMSISGGFVKVLGGNKLEEIRITEPDKFSFVTEKLEDGKLVQTEMHENVDGKYNELGTVNARDAKIYDEVKKNLEEHKIGKAVVVDLNEKTPQKSGAAPEKNPFKSILDKELDTKDPSRYKAAMNTAAQAQAEGDLQDKAYSHLQDKVFSHWTDFIPGSDAEKAQVWGHVSKMKAVDILSGNFPDQIGNQKDLAETGYLENLQKHIGELKSFTDIKTNESVADFISRHAEESQNADMKLLKNFGVGPRDDGKSYVLSVLNKMPGGLKKELITNFDKFREIGTGYIHAMSGDKNEIAAGIQQMLGKGKVNLDDIDINSDGSFEYNDAFGKSGYDVVVTPDKISVKGPVLGGEGFDPVEINSNNLGEVRKFLDQIDAEAPAPSTENAETVDLTNNATASETASAEAPAEVEETQSEAPSTDDKTIDLTNKDSAAEASASPAEALTEVKEKIGLKNIPKNINYEMSEGAQKWLSEKNIAFAENGKLIIGTNEITLSQQSGYKYEFSTNNNNELVIETKDPKTGQVKQHNSFLLE